MEKFDAFKIPLEGVNLVEASAGTGKTYSVALLALRLIVEKNIPVSRILMVTFTNAAVAEMAQRVRKFIRLAIRAAQEAEISDQQISHYIGDRIAANDPNQEEMLKRLHAALATLDEASIQTIHSFCKDSLQLFAFESGQAYSLQLLEDLKDLTSFYVEDFWRIHITGLSVELQSKMRAHKISRITILRAVMESLGGKQFDCGNFQENYDHQLTESVNLINKFLNHNREAIIQQVNVTEIPRFTQKSKEELIQTLKGSPSDLYNWLNEGNSQYKARLKEEVFAAFLQEYDQNERIALGTLSQLIQHAIQVVVKQIKDHLQAHHLLTFDDMIYQLHSALAMREELSAGLRMKYDAVFIDEFQDTDRLQYEIYNQLFGQQKILFYIGDPKQSIYGWRKADLSTYFEAARQPEMRRFSMNRNFRSTPALLDALNVFFSIENPFLNDHFGYVAVESGTGGHPQGVCIPGQLAGNPAHNAAIQIYDAQIKGEIPAMLVRLLAALLDPHTRLNQREVQPADIAILVRTNSEGQKIKGILARHGIPAVNIDETNVFESSEAEYLAYILETVIDISWKGVNKALLNPLTAWNDQMLLSKNADRLVSRFKVYQTIWNEKGIFAMVRQYMLDFEVFRNLNHKENRLGKRRLANINQLLGLLQEAEYRNELKPSGLLAWLRKQRELKQMGENKAFQQKLEDDQQAVTIITIHKAKGLEFPLVIAPYLNFNNEEKGEFSSYRNEAGSYRFYHNGISSGAEALRSFEQQNSQENRRLLYVALTRAKYNCFIFNAINADDATLTPFLNGENDLIARYNIADFPHPESAPNLQGQLPQELTYIEMPNLQLPDANWRKMSFSYLTQKVKHNPRPVLTDAMDGYDAFIFRQLPRGAQIGDMLHSIFERIDFQSEENWSPIAAQSAARYFPQLNQDALLHLTELIRRVASTHIPGIDPGFSLARIPTSRKAAEWEFDINSTAFMPEKLALIPKQHPEMLLRSVEGNQIKGLLNGFVDLVFEHQGKYYILDWKSNYLGAAVENYDEASLMDAMNENNYHLQYLLYTYALHRYLQITVADYSFESCIGGVVYVFLRGLQPEQTTGLFFTRPKQQQMEFLDALFSGKLSS